jgi:hypothetical protein
LHSLEMNNLYPSIRSVVLLKPLHLTR